MNTSSAFHKVVQTKMWQFFGGHSVVNIQEYSHTAH